MDRSTTSKEGGTKDGKRSSHFGLWHAAIGLGVPVAVPFLSYLISSLFPTLRLEGSIYVLGFSASPQMFIACVIIALRAVLGVTFLSEGWSSILWAIGEFIVAFILLYVYVELFATRIY
jgi:predicted membrane-bound dolichyl-phosphate-mannose-protein mannosyltransferase